MNQYLKYVLYILFCVCTNDISAFDFSQKEIIIVPFETYEDFIIVELILQEKLPLKFIFDTGAESTILTKFEIGEVLGFEYDKRFKILGADLSTLMYAKRVKNTSIFMQGLVMRKFLVLEEDYFNFEEMLGINIHGIIGMEAFKDYAIDFDYRRKLLTFIPKELFKKPNKKFQEIPITIHKNKPYLDTKVQIDQDTSLDLTFLIDTGASVSAIIHNNTHPNLSIPDTTLTGSLGTGLGGDLEGYIGIIPDFHLGNFHFEDLIVNYMEINRDQEVRKLKRKKYNGIIGSTLLRRFHMVIDFPNKLLYLKPTSKNYNRAFEFDKSGLSVIAAGASLNRYLIKKAVKDSPSDQAALQRGDEIIRLNGFPWWSLNLNRINSILSKKAGKKIKIVIRRDGQKMEKRFVLRSYL